MASEREAVTAISGSYVRFLPGEGVRRGEAFLGDFLRGDCLRALRGVGPPALRGVGPPCPAPPNALPSGSGAGRDDAFGIASG